MSITLYQSPIIYPADHREVAVEVRNNGDKPTLVQAWLDRGDADQAPDTINVPFLLTPPIFRIDPGHRQTLRITYAPSGEHLPQDRESVFWLNVLEVPPAGANVLATRSRISLFYRPQGLTSG
ncbi:fimbrial biogenesis chaperone [Sorangium sp. So ce131]|uniref:fimbrial biogenesis chaperone n=1 Tax=Sorangium sp. So ce131 TaxID=3133282 RepID=UPI003F611A63